MSDRPRCWAESACCWRRLSMMWTPGSSGPSPRRHAEDAAGRRFVRRSLQLADRPLWPHLGAGERQGGAHTRPDRADTSRDDGRGATLAARPARVRPISQAIRPVCSRGVDQRVAHHRCRPPGQRARCRPSRGPRVRAPSAGRPWRPPFGFATCLAGPAQVGQAPERSSTGEPSG